MIPFELPRGAMEVVAGQMTDTQAELLGAFGREMLNTSARLNLVSRRSLEGLGEHLVDSAALLSVLGSWDGELADLGTGGGLPGIVLAILRPELRVALVEARRKKIVFLKSVTRMLQLENVRVVHERLESLSDKEHFGVATARALGELATALPLCLNVVEPGGRLILYKGPAWRDEVARARTLASEAGAELVESVDVELPGFGRTTTFAVFHVKQG